MIGEGVLAQARKQFTADLMNRDTGLRSRIVAEQNSLSAKGMATSGRAVFQYLDFARDELTVRAGLAWNALVRAERAFGAKESATNDDLIKGFDLLFSSQRAILEAIVRGYARIVSSNMEALVNLKPYEEALRARYANEADFEAAASSLRAAVTTSGSSTLNFHGPVNVVQTGSGSVAHVVISSNDAASLASALGLLRESILADQTVGHSEREQIIGMLQSACDAINKEKLNPSLIRALLGGIGQTVQTIGAAQPAWQAIMDVASAVPGLIGG